MQRYRACNSKRSSLRTGRNVCAMRKKIMKKSLGGKNLPAEILVAAWGSKPAWPGGGALANQPRGFDCHPSFFPSSTSTIANHTNVGGRTRFRLRIMPSPPSMKTNLCPTSSLSGPMGERDSQFANGVERGRHPHWAGSTPPTSYERRKQAIKSGVDCNIR